MVDALTITVRPKRGSYAVASTSSQNGNNSIGTTAGQFLIEWEVERIKRESAFSLVVDLVIEATWDDEKLVWVLTKTSDEIFSLESQVKLRQATSVSANRVLLSSKSNDEFLRIVEESLSRSSDSNPSNVLKFLEASRWTFAKENIYNEPLGPKIKEGGLVKAPGGYESYHKSRWRVLTAQMSTIAISLVLWTYTNDTWPLYVGFMTISLLSLAHWSYYRLSAIDATCVIPCLFLPPVGPILVLVWTIFSFLFVRGDERWFVLRQGHIEFYESWESPKREPVGVLLLDRYTMVRKSAIFPTQFICSTPYRSLRLYASSKRERNEWVEKIRHCVDIEGGCRENDEDGIDSSFVPTRENVPARALVDARDTYRAMAEAIRGAKREIFIAGWMLSPELYLERESPTKGYMMKETAEGGLFQTETPTVVEPKSRHVYRCTRDCLPSDVSFCSLLSYDIVMPEPSVKRPNNVRWTIRVRSNVNVNFLDGWIELDHREHINFERCDPLEPVRFHIGHHQAQYFQFRQDVETTPSIYFVEYEFSFYEQKMRKVSYPKDEETGHNSEQMANEELDTSWVEVEEGSWEPFTCGGIRLFGSTTPESDRQDDDEMDRSLLFDDDDDEKKKNGTYQPGQPLWNRFFNLFARTTLETRLDSLYNLFNAVSSGGAQQQHGQHQLRKRKVAALATSYSASSTPPDSLPLPLVANTMDHDGDMAGAGGEEEDDADMLQQNDRLARKFSPEFASRLDRLIAKKVMEGVKCYILVYRDVDLFLPNASYSAKKKLLAMSLWNRNIQIIRHAPVGRTYGSIQHWVTCSLSRGKTWWSHHEKLLCVDQSVAFIGGLDLAFGRYDDGDHALFDSGARVWKGKDFSNVRYKDFFKLGEDPFSDSIDRKITPRMPWHDIHCCVGGAAAADLSRHFIGRWNAEKRELKPGDDRFGILTPRYPVSSSSSASPSAFGPLKNHNRSTMTSSSVAMSDLTFLSSSGPAPSMIYEGPFENQQIQNMSDGNDLSTSSSGDDSGPSYNVRCQVLRSVAPWSSPSFPECSILDAYCSLIIKSKRFIYIEQQFFSSSLAGQPVRNKIAEVLAQRVIRAIRAKENFKVIVILPVLPAFEGALRDNYSARSVLHWNIRTIRKLLQKCEKELKVQPIPPSFIGFYSLRKAQKSELGKWHSEEIYIHSKLLIVDDEIAVIGSANLNDRSMLGTRDSEVAVKIVSHEMVSKLRRDLFKEHLGYSQDGVESNKASTVENCFTDEWEKAADHNTRLFEKYFPEIPRNGYTTFQKMHDSIGTSYLVTPLHEDSANADITGDLLEVDELNSLQGHLIHFPSQFLCEEPMLLPRVVRMEREGAVPLENFT